MFFTLGASTVKRQSQVGCLFWCLFVSLLPTLPGVLFLVLLLAGNMRHKPVGHEADKPVADDFLDKHEDYRPYPPDPAQEEAREQARRAAGWLSKGWSDRGAYGPDGKLYHRLCPPGESFERCLEEDRRFHRSIDEALGDDPRWTAPPGWLSNLPPPDSHPPEIIPVKRPSADAASPMNLR